MVIAKDLKEVVTMNLQSIPVVIRREIPNAKLPVNYQAARTAISQCARIDECKDWQDKAAAIASYARQVNDKSMMEAAQRIMLRARERLGELLLEYRNGSGRANDPSARHKIAEQHGISKSQAASSIAIARVPKQVRDELIERSPPIGVSQLAYHAPRVRPRFEIRPEHRSFEVDGIVASMYRQMMQLDPVKLATEMEKEDVAFYRAIPNGERVSRIEFMQEWLDAFEQALPRSDSKSHVRHGSVDVDQRYSIDEASALLRQSRSQTYKQIESGDLSVIKDGRRTYVPGSEIVRRSQVRCS